MDKYTVDLDQVLNDFEYSELTTEQQEQQQQVQSTSSTLPSKTYSIEKHSINNVFTSLNEYLSSEINDKVADNKYVDNNCTYQAKIGTSTLASQAINHNDLEPATATKCILPELNIQEVSFKIDNSIDKASAKEDEITEVEVVSNQDDSQTNKNETLGKQEDFQNMTPVKQVPLELLINDPILLKIEDTIEVSQEPELEKSKDALIDKLVEEVVIEHEPKKPICEARAEIALNHFLIDYADNVGDTSEHQANITNIECDTKNTNTKIQDKIGFEVDINDEEARRLLDDLDMSDEEDFHEAEDESPTTTAEVNLNTENTGESVESHTTSTMLSNTDETISESLQKPIELDNKLNELVDEVSNTNICKDDIVVELEEKDQKNSSLTDTETTTVDYEPTIIEAHNFEASDEPSSQDEILEIEIEEEIMEEPQTGVKDEVVMILQEQNVENSNVEPKGNVNKTKLGDLAKEAQRPNSLDIKEDPITRIGDPGSTPYNNIYVSKQVQNNENQNEEGGPATTLNQPQTYESESSASVSPTFSEASTDSVRSTDSPILPKKNGSNAKNTARESDEQDIEGDDEEEVEPSANEQRAVASSEGMGSEQFASHISALATQLSEEEEVYVDLDSIAKPDAPGPSSEQSEDVLWLGKRAPIWIPDADALNCQHCDLKFTVIKRRHHCRACGLVLCSKCCNMKYKLEYMNCESRVCTRCFDILNRETDSGSGDSQNSTPHRQADGEYGSGARMLLRNAGDNAGQPNPNNPMEYCSVVPPIMQIRGGDNTPPSVMVPVGVLKREGSNKKHNKSVMFCDGIRPGSDLTNLDNDFNYNENRKQSSSSHQQNVNANAKKLPKVNKNLPLLDPVTQSFIPENENCLPPTVTTYKSDITYTECGNNSNVLEMLKNETLIFAVQRNLHIHVRLINMDCCINKQAWCFSTEGLITVGQDEIVILLEYIENETQVPKDVFHHLNNIYNSAVKGTTVTELGLSIHPTTNFLDSRSHAGFIFVRPTYQCLQNVIIPKEPYLVGILVHRWETPWARIFPLRLVLRLGAEYRYYPSPLISTRHRDSVFVEIGHTIINLLADFRNFSYTLPNIRGLTIHMEEERRKTTVSIPVNRYDQVMKSISNSSEHILAFGGNFSSAADSHLVCIQDTQGSNENNYKTHAINIQNKPRKVTGASFIVFNGALKSSSGLTAKSSIVEDGLMIQIPPEHMIKVRESLRIMKDHTIQCGCVNVASDETVNIVWCEADVNFNIGVTSSVDGQSLNGVPSIRVHNGKDFMCNSGSRLIRWTEVFLLQSGEENARTQDPVDISKVAESISKATCQALVKYLDLLATNNFIKIGIRTTLHVDDVSYSAGSNGMKLPPIYMRSLDNELVPVLHRITSGGNVGDGTIVLELIFRILNV